MTLGNKTTFGRACGAGSKIVFFVLPLNAQNMQNKPFFFQVAKNHSEAMYRDSRASRVRLNANLPPPPPPPPPAINAYFLGSVGRWVVKNLISQKQQWRFTMNKVKSVLFSAGILLALGFTFGCSSDSGGGGNHSSNSVAEISSSGGGNSSDGSSLPSSSDNVGNHSSSSVAEISSSSLSLGQSSSSIYIQPSPTCNLACVESTIDAMMSATRDNYVCKYGISSETTLKISDSCKCPSADVYAVKNRLCNVSSSSSMPSSSSNVPLSSSSLAQSSSSVEVFSSSSMTSSSSSEVTSVGYCEDFVDGTPREHYGKNKAQFCDSRDGQKYVYVTIGTRTWMAENLNYNANGSKCGDGSTLSDENTTTCDIYGRLYNWFTATEVCPQSWHLPNKAEWSFLESYGTLLKATNGWDNNGQDTYGFSALPSGLGYPDDSFYYGNVGRWWSALEYDSGSAYSLIMSSNFFDHLIGDVKSNLYSVRCVRD